MYLLFNFFVPLFNIQEALQSSGAMVDYRYDVNEELWCQFTLRVSLYGHSEFTSVCIS